MIRLQGRESGTNFAAVPLNIPEMGSFFRVSEIVIAAI